MKTSMAITPSERKIMYGAIYSAEMWCEDCAEKIKQDYRDGGFAPEDEDDQGSYDSDEFPKDCEVSCESDTPEHCAAGDDCINAFVLDGCKIGCWLENDLTTDGEDYVIEAVHEGGAVAELWADYYNYLDFSTKCADCGEDFDPDDLDEHNYCVDCA